MIKNKKTILKSNKKRMVSGMEGYRSDEDEEEEEPNKYVSSCIQEADNEDSVSESLIKHELDDYVDSSKISSLPAKVDIFDGRLEQFNKFLEFIVMPKNSINKKKKTTGSRNAHSK